MQGMNLKVLQPSRKRIKPGDIFAMQPSDDLFVFGRVIRMNVEAWEGAILIYIYKADGPAHHERLMVLHIHVQDLPSLRVHAPFPRDGIRALFCLLRKASGESWDIGTCGCQKPPLMKVLTKINNQPNIQMEPPPLPTVDGTGSITENMIPIELITEADVEHADEVLKLSERARDYLCSMPWCDKILRGWLDYACGYIIGVFYFQIVPHQSGVPHFVWIIVGDLPPAYMDGEFHRSDVDALLAYVTEMQEWVDRVLSGRPIDDDVITVNVPPERKWAESLQTRLEMVRELFLGKRNDDLDAPQ